MRDVLPPRTSVAFGGLPAEVYEGTLPADYVRFGQLEVFFSWYFADQAVTAERLGYDAYVIGTSQDPGLDMARTLVSIPVVGYGETSFGFLHGQGLRFGVVGFIPELEEALRENIVAGGWSESSVGFQYLNGGRQLIEQAVRTGEVTDLVPAMERAAQVLRRNGAQAIVPGEGLPNEVLWAAGVRELAGLPLIDADGLAVTRAEMLVRTRRLGIWGTGDDGYRTRQAPVEEVDRLRRIFASSVSQAHRR